LRLNINVVKQCSGCGPAPLARSGLMKRVMVLVINAKSSFVNFVEFVDHIFV
jgi:hypothetical protein